MPKQNDTQNLLQLTNRCFLSFGADSEENINKIFQTLENIFEDSPVIYCKHHDNEKCKANQDDPYTKICEEIIKTKGDEPVEFHNLDIKTSFLINTKLKNCLICLVKADDDITGSICIFRPNDRKFEKQEINIFAILTKVLGIEEQRKNIKEELVRTKELSENASKLKSEYLANLSFAVRTPLNAIIGYSEMLGATELTNTQRDFLSTIYESGQLLLAEIHDIIDVSKIESGEIRLQEIPFDLEYLISSIFKIINPKLKNKNIELSYDFAENTPKSFTGDPTRLRQILINLLNIALKFTPKGEISIKVGMENNLPEKSILKISFKITGTGLTDDVHEQILESLSLPDKLLKGNLLNTKLMYKVTKTIVEMMDGRFKVETEPGKTSEFIVTLKLKKLMPDFSSEITPLTLTELKGKTVVIVDDQEYLHPIVELYLNRFGMIVLHKNISPKRTLEWLKNAPQLPDLIISDIRMIDMSGFEFAKNIRETPLLKDIKILALTADARPGIALETHKAGFDAFLPKPIDKDEFINVIRATLGKTQTSNSIITKHSTKELDFNKSIIDNF